MGADFLFLADIAFHFHKGFVDESNTIVRDHVAIAKRYLRSWLLLDVASSLPLDLLLLNVTPSSGSSGAGEAVSALKFLRVLKVLRIVKLQEVGRRA